MRLWGCNLRCFFCDTDFESRRKPTNIGELEDEVNSQPGIKTKLIVLTGGEPFRQNIIPWAQRMLADDWHIQVETAGTLWVPGLEQLLATQKLDIVCSPKTGKVHAKIEEYCRHWKYLIKQGDEDSEDGLPTMSTQREGHPTRLARPPTRHWTHARDTVWLQPCEEYFVDKIHLHLGSEQMDAFNAGELSDQMVTKKAIAPVPSQRNVAAAVAIAMKHGYRLSLQIHKQLGLP